MVSAHYDRNKRKHITTRREKFRTKNGRGENGNPILWGEFPDPILNATPERFRIKLRGPYDNAFSKLIQKETQSSCGEKVSPNMIKKRDAVKGSETYGGIVFVADVTMRGDGRAIL